MGYNEKVTGLVHPKPNTQRSRCVSGFPLEESRADFWHTAKGPAGEPRQEITGLPIEERLGRAPESALDQGGPREGSGLPRQCRSAHREWRARLASSRESGYGRWITWLAVSGMTGYVEAAGSVMNAISLTSPPHSGRSRAAMRYLSAARIRLLAGTKWARRVCSTFERAAVHERPVWRKLAGRFGLGL